MTLKILLPFQIFAEKTNVSRIVAETHDGSFGLLPQRLDCVAAIAPGILTYETTTDGEVFVAVDEGVLVKTGPDVLVSVRRALVGKDLGQLREAASTIPDDITARFDTADKLSDDDRAAILAIATTALAPFQPKPEPKQ